jgi:Cu/Zn superoxide dismutase
MWLMAATIAILLGQAAAASASSSDGSADGSCQFWPTLTCYLASTQSLDAQNKTSTVTGKVDFTPFFDSRSRTCRTRITGTISGLRNILHGWHVHEKGDISSTTGMATGAHYNPFNVRLLDTFTNHFRSLCSLVLEK